MISRVFVTLVSLIFLSACGSGSNPFMSEEDRYQELLEESRILATWGGDIKIPTDFFLREITNPAKLLYPIPANTRFMILGKETGKGGGDANPDLETDFYRVQIMSGPRSGAMGLMRTLYVDDPTLNGKDGSFADDSDSDSGQIPRDHRGGGSIGTRKAYKKLADRIHRNTDISKTALYSAYEYLRRNRKKFRTTGVLSVIDFSLSSRKKRWVIIDLKTSSYKLYRTAHGSGSDRNNDGIAEKLAYDFSKDRRKRGFAGSHMSQLGFVKVGGVGRRRSNKRKYLSLIGLERKYNNSFVRRQVIVHDDWGQGRRPSGYMARSLPGRSQGCVVSKSKELSGIISRMRDGTLLYAYSPILKKYKSHRQYEKSFLKGL